MVWKAAVAKSALVSIVVPRSGQHHIDRASIAMGTDKPVAPIQHVCRVTMSSREVRGAGPGGLGAILKLAPLRRRPLSRRFAHREAQAGHIKLAVLVVP